MSTTTPQRDWKHYEPGRFGDHLQEAQVLMARIDPRLFQEAQDSPTDTISLAIAYCLVDIADNLRTIVAQQQQTMAETQKARMV